MQMLTIFALPIKVKRIAAHKGPVNEICFDEAVEYIASCSDDGTVVVRSLHKMLQTRLVFHTAPLLTQYCMIVALLTGFLFADPRILHRGNCHLQVQPANQGS